jgi:hypothetical protein
MHDVISAFLDNEPFDAQELAVSLGTTEGRDVLLDLIALRTVVQPPDPQRAAAARPRSRWMLASAAAVLLALIGGYQFGRVQGRTTDTQDVISSVAAPEPTTVLKFEPGVNWTETPRTGGK